MLHPLNLNLKFLNFFWQQHTKIFEFYRCTRLLLYTTPSSTLQGILKKGSNGQKVQDKVIRANPQRLKTFKLSVQAKSNYVFTFFFE